MNLQKREKLIKKINLHFRTIARQLVTFDSEEEALQCLIASFQSELECDFVSLLYKDEEKLVPKATAGESKYYRDDFPLSIFDCIPNLFEHSMMFENENTGNICRLSNLMKKENIRSWFTVLVKDQDKIYGVCVIGFRNFVPLYEEMHNAIMTFGEDVALALSLARQKEEQLKKMAGMEWITQNFSLNYSLDDIIAKLLERAGRATNASAACFYLFNEKDNSFVLQDSTYGEGVLKERIIVANTNKLKDYFYYLEKPGGNELTVSMMINFKIIGVLHVVKKLPEETFTQYDVELLDILSNHGATIIDNLRLYQNEKENQQRLHLLLDFQHSLVKETLKKESLEGITKTVSLLFSKSVVVFNRFMSPISYHLFDQEKSYLETFVEQATYYVFRMKQGKGWFQETPSEQMPMMVWPINGGGDLVGYIAIDILRTDVDDFIQLSIDMALNVFSIQFIKQKLVFRAKEQVKDSIMNRLLVEKIEDKGEIIQYANVFSWDLFNEHRVAVIKVELDGVKKNEQDILRMQAKRNAIEELIKTRLVTFDPDIIFNIRGEIFVLMLPITKERNNPKKYWNEFYAYIQNFIRDHDNSALVIGGIGGVTQKLEDYYVCYKQAEQAMTVVFNRQEQTGFAWYDELGAYTLLHDLKDSETAKLFLMNQIGTIIDYSDGKNMDLFQTLRTYLLNNGNIKETSEELYIHRSTLQYRIEKIHSLLDVNLNDAEQRFNLLLAFKLYDLIDQNAMSIKNN